MIFKNIKYNVKMIKLINENEQTLENWSKLMDKLDSKIYDEYITLSNTEIKFIRENWKFMRIYALERLNKDLNNQGIQGQIMSIDVSDEELYPYINDEQKIKFFKYSRILDFKNGYMPR
jgi:radical SAM superfamily enzyme